MGDRFRLDGYVPAAVRAHHRRDIAWRVEAGLAELAECRACPRSCGIDRMRNETKVCNTGRHAVVSSAFPHFGEEDCLRGHRGSGTIFFGLCNLRCVFCQNWDISQQRSGGERDAKRIAGMMMDLQQRGCHNINFVTPEHVVPQVIEAIAEAIPRGLDVPIVYNTSAYDSIESLKLLDGLIDVYMPDFKFWDQASAARLARAKDYPQRAREAIAEMHRQVGPLMVDAGGIAQRGLLVRHLVMPGQTDEAAAIFRWLADELSVDTYVNIMGQYRPEYEVGEVARNGALRYEDINRAPSRRDMKRAYAAARDAGLWRFDERAESISVVLR